MWKKPGKFFTINIRLNSLSSPEAMSTMLDFITLGTAEGGRKVILYGVNLFKIKGMEGYNASRDSAFVKDWFLHTIHHEFGHILHQTVLYPVEYKNIYEVVVPGW